MLFSVIGLKFNFHIIPILRSWIVSLRYGKHIISAMERAQAGVKD